MAVRFDESNVRAMGRSARGVRGMSLAANEALVSMAAVVAGDSLLTVCENGYGKRTGIEEYRKTRRGGKGVINIKTTERNGKVVRVLAVADDDEIMIITANGMMLRTDLTHVREIGRATQGVRLIRLDENDKVVAVAKLAKEDDGDGQEEAPADAAADELSGDGRVADAAPDLGPAADDAPPTGAETPD
jgi:DNA gyrase subunit A